MNFYIVIMLIALFAIGAWLFWRLDQAPYPFVLRWLLNIPLPWLTNKRLTQALAPRPGERILEIGPGTGLQSLAVASHIGNKGRLDIVDIQQRMLEYTMLRAHEKSFNWVIAAKCDAQNLPFATNSFDGAYIVTALGEIPSPLKALDELHRVIKPQGRLVVGEWTMDRHGISLSKLKKWAEASGFTLEFKQGPWLAYFARLKLKV